MWWDTLVLQLLVSVQDRSGQGWFFSKISAFTHGTLFRKMSRGKTVLANQEILVEVIGGQNYLKDRQNQSTSVSLRKLKKLIFLIKITSCLLPPPSSSASTPKLNQLLHRNLRKSRDFCHISCHLWFTQSRENKQPSSTHCCKVKETV